MMPIGQISPRLRDPFSEIMPPGGITPCNPPTRSSQRQQDVLSDVATISSARSHSTATRRMVIVIAIKAHEKMRVEPFGYVFNQLIQQQNCKVVVICCLSRIRSELGYYLMIDDDAFNGISKKKLAATINELRKNLNHFLTMFQEGLDRKGVELTIHIPVGRKSENILVQAAKTFHPLWVVLDSSWATFSGNQHKTVQAALQECNLVLIKNSKPVVLQLTTQTFVPVQESQDQVDSEEFVDPVSNTSSPSSPNSRRSNPITPTVTTETPISSPITPPITTETPSSSPITRAITMETASSNQITSAITTETSSSNQIIDSNQSTATIPTEMSSSNKTTPTITPETPTSNRTTAIGTTEASQTANGTPARGQTFPSPPPSQVAIQGRLKGFYNRITSTGPLFPDPTVRLHSPDSGSGTSTTGRANRGSLIALSPSRSVTSKDQSNRKSPLKPILKKVDSRSKPTVGANRSNSPASNEDISYEIALKIAMEASIRSAIEERVPGVSLSALNLSSWDDGGAGPSDRTNADVGRFGGLIGGGQCYNCDRGHGSSAGTSVADIPGNSGSLQPTRSPSPRRLGYWSPSAPPLPSYPFVDTSPVLENCRYTAGPSDGLPAKQKQKAEDTSSGRCVICWCAPADAVCVPCGHIAGCQNCLTKAKHWGCPLCRAKIQQVIKVYLNV